MTMPTFLKTALLEILAEYSDLQSRAGCTDFDLVAVVPELEHRQAIMKKFHELNGDPEDFEYDLAQGRTFEYLSFNPLLPIVKDWVKNNL